MTSEEQQELFFAAESGNVDCQIELAARLATGDEVDKDLEKSVFWYEAAVKNGSSLAMFNLALMYLFGEGVERNVDEALKLLCRAAELGSFDANIMLGDAYAEGELGLPKNSLKAAQYYIASCPAGASRAIHGVGKLLLSGGLSSDDLGNLMISFSQTGLAR